MREIWALGIDCYLAAARIDDKIHIFHCNRAEKDLIAHYQSTDETVPAVE